MIAVIGLDGATWDLAWPLVQRGEMPALRALAERGAWGTLRSTIPPVTFPAWSSFMTGCNPGKHGVFDFTRRIPGTYQLAFVSSRDRRMPTIWRLLSDGGRRVAALGVPTTYPPEPVNGIMVGGFDSPVATGIDGSFVYPRAFYDEMRRAVGPYSITDFQELTIGPRWHAEALPRILAGVDRKCALARYVLRRERWDCFMVLFGEADTASHHFWMFADPCSPRFDAHGAARFGDALRTVYRRLDAALGAIVNELPQGATVLVASDHGFGGAGATAIHLNRWLADQGWLRFHTGTSMLGARAARCARRAALAALPRGLQERLVRRLGRGLARRLEGWTRFASIDMGRTRAFSEELNYAPSIWLNVRGRDPAGVVTPGEEYDALVAAITRGLKEWRNPRTAMPIVQRVHRRDTLYHGPAVDGAPDLVLELADEAGYSYACLPTVPSESRTVRPLAPEEYVSGKGGGMNGSHRAMGMWALAGPTILPRSQAEAAIEDVAPTVLHLLSEPVPSWMDGTLLPGVDGRIDLVHAEPPLTRVTDGPDGEAELWRRLAGLGYLDEASS